MVELSFVIWGMAIIFAYIGFSRGWTKEIISTSGIILGLFALHQFDTLLRRTLLVALPQDQVFYVQSFIFLLIVFFAYQTRALVGADAERARRSGDGRDTLQSSVLGAIVGFINGYLIFGSIWYFLDINRTAANAYPLDPYVIAPLPNSPSAAALGNLPLYVLAQGPGGTGELLSLAVIGLFIFVLILI